VCVCVCVCGSSVLLGPRLPHRWHFEITHTTFCKTLDEGSVHSRDHNRDIPFEIHAKLMETVLYTRGCFSLLELGNVLDAVSLLLL